MANLVHVTLTIAKDATDSDAQPVYGKMLSGFYMPAGWDSSTLKLQGSHNGTTWYDIYSVDTGSQYAALTPTQARYYFFATPVHGLAFIKAIAGSAQTTALRTIIVPTWE